MNKPARHGSLFNHSSYHYPLLIEKNYSKLYFGVAPPED